MKKPADQQRNAERIPLTEPIDGTIESAEAHIVELSLIGAKIEHFNRLSMGASATVQFRWKGKPIKIKGKIARTEMRSMHGKTGYMSGVTFAPRAEEAPQELRWIMSTFVETLDVESELPPLPPPQATPPPPPPAAPKPAASKPAQPAAAPAKPAPVRKAPTPPPMPAPFLTTDEDVEEIDAGMEVPPYVKCVFRQDGVWEKTPTDDPKQPLSGFTMLSPDDESEVNDFCRTYEMADPETQRMIRLSFELGIAQFRRK